MAKLLAIDYGTRKMGLSISDENHSQAFGYMTIPADDAIEQISKVIKDESIEKIVLGLPLAMDGKESPQTEQVRKFGSELGKQTGVSVVYEDERLSTAMFSRNVPRRVQKDIGIDDHQWAAQEILNSYLNRK